MKLGALLALLLFAAPVYSQDTIPTAVFLGGAVADNLTTWHNMQRGFTEADPLYAFAKDQPKGVLISLIATDVLTLWLAHHYAPTHPKIVTAVLFTLGGIRTANSIHNVTGWNTYANRPFNLAPH